MASSPAWSVLGTWQQHSLRTLAKLLSILVVTSCLINISYLGRQLGVQLPQNQYATPLSSIQQYTLTDRRPQRPVKRLQQPDLPRNVSLPVIIVDDGFSAEDASYSVSEDEEEPPPPPPPALDVPQKTANVTQSAAALSPTHNDTKEQLDAVIKSDKDGGDQDKEDRGPAGEELDEFLTLRLLDILATNSTALSMAVADKRKVLSLLLEAGIESLDLATIRDLPNWAQIESLYYPSGKRPVIHGLESCDAYRQTVDLNDRYLGTAGLFNTGTNALSFLLRENIIMQRKAQWQVPWSKHRLLRISHNHTAPNMIHFDRRHVLPIVIIKDVFTWLQSMCRSPYEARWKHSRAHCPNLVPNEWDLEHFPILQGHKSVPVKVKFSGNQTMHWESLVGLYNEWYREYYDASFPRLMVRFEDLLFAPEELLQAVADCVGAELAQTVVYNTESAKDHGSQTTLIGAMIKTAKGSERWRNMTLDDVDFVNKMLDEELRTTFDYSYTYMDLPQPSRDEAAMQ